MPQALRAWVVRRPLLPAVTAGVAVVCTVSYSVLVLAFDPTQMVALGLRQVFYLTIVWMAAAATCTAALVGQPGSRERAIWAILAFSLSMLALSETYFSLHQVLLDPAGPGTWGVDDLLNLLAAGGLLGLVAFAADLARASWSTRLRVAADCVALIAVAYATVYRLWMHGLVAREQALPTQAVLWTVYVVIGLVLLIGVGAMAISMSGRRQHPWGQCVALGLAILAVGLVLTPLWQSAPGTSPSPSTDVLSLLANNAYLAAFALIAVGAAMRAVAADDPWRHALIVRLEAAGPLGSAGLTAVVIAAVSVLGIAYFSAPTGSLERGVYLYCGFVAVLAASVRTAAATAESGLLRDRSETCPVTGALNHRRFHELVAELAGGARRQPSHFVVAVIDLDEFSRVNASVGYAGGDAVLATAARALERAVGQAGVVFRLSGDEFAIVFSQSGIAEALPLTRAALSELKSIEIAGLPLTASAGLCVCPDHATAAAEIVHCADGAQAWAKFHGKNQIVVYDERTVRSLSVEERLRLDEERARMEVARALVAAADTRDPSNYYHSRNVSALCMMLAEDLELDAERVRRIEVAAMLHDVGKIALDDGVLTRSAHSPRERRAMQEHSELGQRLLGSLEMDGVALWVRAHHERWDGQGYPDGLVGEAIPLEARMIALADAYDGMTSGKRYGAPMSKAAALQEIDHAMGSRFDPELAERFIALVGVTTALGWSDEWPAA